MEWAELKSLGKAGSVWLSPPQATDCTFLPYSYFQMEEE